MPTIVTPPDASVEELRRFLRALYGDARPGLLVELRLRASTGMGAAVPRR